MSVLVVGTDFSARSDRALRRAVLLGKEAGYDLSVVHVLDGRSSESMPDPKTEACELLAGMQRSIIEADGVSCRTDVRIGDVGDKLVEAATEADAALILVGPHKRALLRDWLSGSTAEQIISQAKTPLLVVNDIPEEPWRRCLLPVDFRPAARRTANAAFNFPFLSKSIVVFVHIYDTEAREMLGRALVLGSEREDYLRHEAQTASAKLRNFVDGLGRGQAKLVVRENGGSIARSLEMVCSEEEADLIIVSSSNKGVVERAIVGSVTKDLLQHGTTDIMVVPSIEDSRLAEWKRMPPFSE